MDSVSLGTIMRIGVVVGVGALYFLATVDLAKRREEPWTTQELIMLVFGFAVFVIAVIAWVS